MKIKKFQLKYLNSNMFVIIKNHKAILIDPNISEKAYKFLKKNDVEEILIILTHSHYDHTSGTEWFSDRFKSKILAHKDCAKLISNKKNNRPLLMCMVLKDFDKKDNGNRVNDFLNSFKSYKIIVDILIESIYKLEWENYLVVIKHTPGHSRGSICIFIENRVFSGDYLIKDVAVNITKPYGSKKDYISTTIPILSKIKLGTLIYPGHGEVYRFSKLNIGNLKLIR